MRTCTDTEWFEGSLEMYFKLETASLGSFIFSGTEHFLNKKSVYTIKGYLPYWEDFAFQTYSNWYRVDVNGNPINMKRCVVLYEDDKPWGSSSKDDLKHTLFFYIQNKGNPSKHFYTLKHSVDDVFFDRSDCHDSIFWDVQRGKQWLDYWAQITFTIYLYPLRDV
ncbi:MAG: hypothetical protein ACTSP3_03245 [Candidatus Heimdallarchaeaceae archaeon]